ncbi:MAG: DUF4398 domain-containing protein [Pseudomonas sp.]
MNIRPLFVVAAFAALVGCANDPAPIEQLRLSDRAVEQAKAVGATEEVTEMALAQTKLVEAHADLAANANKQARMQAEQAELDARLAEAKVLTAKSQEQLSQVDIRVNRLRKQVRDAQ